jgi:hypothetical protein
MEKSVQTLFVGRRHKKVKAKKLRKKREWNKRIGVQRSMGTKCIKVNVSKVKEKIERNKVNGTVTQKNL